MFAVPLVVAGTATLLSRLSPGLAWGMIVFGIGLLAIAAEARRDRRRPEDGPCLDSDSFRPDGSKGGA